ncbi:TetR family transcriptional regulator C-terminal domain-containing protein [Flavobacterium sp. NG2]|uniref:TetR family transcriptional regulator C-terminal domain-containing protein n=1 Tax=Flavobacterium sp. NG2 TaxID=3097547 RepID=UPI002A81069D|nr:TetR family transcriptional regulator C-terminal domain-containing protein [Flavobacterium sp. NG2]WPR71050.1 TetR family transcriptional regulator C-terminal domain-containing protein [Flavobacterium sp. NG2]
MATKKIKITKEYIINQYMNYKLEHNEIPQSVHAFAKANGMTESDFYKFFGAMEAIEKEIYLTFLNNTIEMIETDTNYSSYDTKTKLLSFYFTFFELLTANRSYVKLSLNNYKNQLKNILQLSSLHQEFKKYIASIVTEDFLLKQEKVQDFQQKAIQEAAWIQLLLTLKFWLDDDSASFEKTDIYIEKSVKLSFELINIAPIESLIDFGKFIFKEKINRQ